MSRLVVAMDKYLYSVWKLLGESDGDVKVVKK
jgi:hypothetical protein